MRSVDERSCVTLWTALVGLAGGRVGDDWFRVEVTSHLPS